MKNSIYIILLFAIQVLFSTCKKESFNNKWQLTFSDEFTDTVLNRKVWKTEFEWGQSSSDDNKYFFSDSAFHINNGVLHIQAKRDTVMGLVHDNNYNYFKKQFYVTSGMLQSDETFAQQYGYFEIRSKIPYGVGFWPSFWLMTHGSWPPEIDIFEMSGKFPNQLQMTNHFNNRNEEHRQNGQTIKAPDFSKDFHVFAVEWNPKEIIWYLDNEKVFKSEIGIPDEKMYLILTLLIGGTNFSGEIDKTTPMPNSFDIDYIRVYQKKN